ncbi:protein of unknown function DUF171 [Pyrolobus fumarii 1A]|uniref:RNA-binding protein n=1 Tax=Pyrolobus fumarii (strain DSM 11204 / 1A) TaxID=694429 RepID=G0ECE5_PYRF1|nr:RNA methyltransferase [Pyrolobus fumarii]AEM39515.1 protein of unknown function DUF171 [Pyrolobus fumarii 1A]
MAGDWPPPPREKELEIVVPASVLSVEPSLQLKTVKAGVIGRAAAVFRASRIVLYVDRAEAWRDLETFRKLLEYLATPPYLRKRVYPPGVPELRYAGLLPPLQIPTHGVGGPKEGEIREAYVLRKRGRSVVVDAGLEEEVEVDLPRGVQVNRGERILVKIVSLTPPILEYVENPPVYTGYRVATFDSLGDYLRSARKDTLLIATSRRGRRIDEVVDELRKKLGEKKRVALLFGSPREGLYEIAEREGIKLDESVDAVVNVVPNQGTLTVRTEEAVWAALSLLNILLG